MRVSAEVGTWLARRSSRADDWWAAELVAAKRGTRVSVVIPARDEAGVEPDGGGRVTELVARPLLNMYWPELAGFVQPLAGEYAGRREVLEGIPFVTHYGVEVGHLIDLLELHGLDALAQALGRMAAQIMLTLMDRLLESLPPEIRPENSPALRRSA
ncbi:hypothetical protein ACIA2T_11960 [Amycolatopsis japonica]|uniref:hypothetical protein n=1 Tax=Amycolatopsis japonica TaxID=208439 RepID=UPI0037A149F7